jgi:carbon starvation protein
MSEKDIKFIGVGSMLIEGLVSILALVAAASLLPYDYFAINLSSIINHQVINKLKS